MARGNAALAFAAGMGNGYFAAKDKAEKQARDDEDRQMRREKFDAEMDEVNQQRQQRIALQDAARPATVTDGAQIDFGDGQQHTYDDAGVANSDLRQAQRLADVGSANGTDGGTAPRPSATSALTVNGTAFPDRASAQKAADVQNTPEAVQQRALAAGADPAKAIGLASAMTQNKAGALELTEAQRTAAAKALAEGHHESAQAMLTGDPQAVFKAFNAQGDVKLKGVPTVTERMVDVPGVGKLKTYDYGGTLVYPDGTEKTGTINSHDFNVSLLPYKDQIEEMRKGTDTAGKLANAKTALENAAERNRLTGEAATAKIEAARAKADNGDKPPAGYRRTASGDLQAIPGGPADQKIQGAFNQDTAALTGSMSSFDRLQNAANELKNHPGLEGITSWRGRLPNTPGSEAANAEALFNTLKSQIGFGVLQDMRNNSKTGGALGAVSDAEGKRLEQNLAALDKSQSLDEFKKNLDKVITYTDQAKERMRDAFNMRHGDRQPTQSGGATGGWGGDQKAAPATPAVPAAKVTSKADVAKLPSGTLFQLPGDVRPDGTPIIRRKP